MTPSSLLAEFGVKETTAETKPESGMTAVQASAVSAFIRYQVRRDTPATSHGFVLVLLCARYAARGSREVSFGFRRCPSLAHQIALIGCPIEGPRSCSLGNRRR